MEKVKLWDLLPEDREWYYRQASTDISYNALKQGNSEVSKLRVSQQRSGFDLDIVNDDGSKTIIGVKASNQGKFYISSEELDALKESSVDSDYIIHWYKFRDKKVIKFTAYKYDRGSGMLVDIADPSNICPIREVFGVTDYGTPGVSLECLPRSIANNFEIKMDKLFGEVDYKKTAMEISYNALRQSKACVAKLKDPNQVFDLEVVNGDGSKTMIGVKASDDNNFYLICQELLAMQQFCCQIHRYKFKGNRIVSRNIYAYDKEKNVLVDIANPKSICTIEQKTMDVNGVQVIRHECTPKKKRFIKIA